MRHDSSYIIIMEEASQWPVGEGISFRVYDTINKLGMLVLSLHMQKRDGLHHETRN